MTGKTKAGSRRIDPTGAHLATLFSAPEGWAAFLPDSRYKSGGDLAGLVAHAIGLVRFEPGELDPYLPGLRIPDDEPLIPDLRPPPRPPDSAPACPRRSPLRVAVPPRRCLLRLMEITATPLTPS